MYELALFLHILSAFFLFAGAFAAAAAQEVARRRSDPAGIAGCLRVARIGALSVMPATVAVLAFGLWLMALGGYTFAEMWIANSLSLLVVAAVLGALGGRRPRQARELAERMAAGGGGEEARIRALLNDRTSLVLNYAATVAIVVALGLMVFKP